MEVKLTMIDQHSKETQVVVRSLPAILGRLANGALPHSITEQAELMFANAEEGLFACGMTFLDVERTWIYLSIADFALVRRVQPCAQHFLQDPFSRL